MKSNSLISTTTGGTPILDNQNPLSAGGRDFSVDLSGVCTAFDGNPRQILGTVKAAFSGGPCRPFTCVATGSALARARFYLLAGRRRRRTRLGAHLCGRDLTIVRAGFYLVVEGR